jgi:hypothetical protein
MIGVDLPSRRPGEFCVGAASINSAIPAMDAL